MTLTQDDFEQHLQYMWDHGGLLTVGLLLGYSYAMTYINPEWHQDCMFLIGILREKERLA